MFLFLLFILDLPEKILDFILPHFTLLEALDVE
jgi:hypothetical protein